MAEVILGSRAVVLGGSEDTMIIRDEDDMVGNSNVSLSTQQAIKAYVDAAVLGLTFNKVVTTDVTAGANIWSAAEMIGGILLRDPTGADRSDVTATGAAIIAALGSAGAAGHAFEFYIRNTADADETITLTAGVNVTLTGNMTIAWGMSRRFLCLVTGAATVTIYDLGEPETQIVSVPIGYTQNTTVYTGCIAVTQTMQITAVTIASVTKPADADGTITLALTNRDVSVPAGDNLLVGATFDLESLTALTSEDLALTATAADLIIENTDFVYATVISNGATIETAPAGLVLTFHLTLL